MTNIFLQGNFLVLEFWVQRSCKRYSLHFLKKHIPFFSAVDGSLFHLVFVTVLAKQLCFQRTQSEEVL